MSESLQNSKHIQKSSSDSIFNIQIKEERLLTKREIAYFLNVSIKTIDKKVSLNEIPFMKIGRLVRFNIREVLAWLNGESN